jgi:nucleoside-diphosphate-sugar epimerase
VVPVNALSFTSIEPAAFALLDVEDAAAAFLAALRTRLDGPVNVVPDGTITPLAAVKLGGRVPLPIVGPGWVGTRVLSRAIGAPIPSHLHELLLRGREADGAKAAAVLGVTPQRPTDAVVRALYDWAPVVYLRPGQAEVA